MLGEISGRLGLIVGDGGRSGITSGVVSGWDGLGVAGLKGGFRGLSGKFGLLG